METDFIKLLKKKLVNLNTLVNTVIIFLFCKILLAFNLIFPDVWKTFPLKLIMTDSNLVNYTFVSRLETFFPLYLIPPETENAYVPNSFIREIRKATS